MVIFFATDIHGSEICFRKLLRAPAFYKADVLLLGGDITGKAVQLIIQASNSKYRTTFDGEVVEIDSLDALNRFIEHASNIGLYPYVTTPDEVAGLKQNAGKADALFKSLIIKRLDHWIEMLDKELGSSAVRLMICPGNDDDLFIDEVLSRSDRIINLGNRALPLDEYTDIVSVGYSNPTPWHTPREMSEDGLERLIDELLLKVRDSHHAIFNFHVPPKNTPIDRCAKLDGNLHVVTHLGHQEMFSAGSEAVRKAVERYQPALGLFGHIHEARGFTRIGQCLCINPGSNYAESALNGCIISVDRGRVSNFHLTSG